MPWENKSESNPHDACKSIGNVLLSPHFLKHLDINVLSGEFCGETLWRSWGSAEGAQDLKVHVKIRSCKVI